jgi:cell division septation protein DedD
MLTDHETRREHDEHDDRDQHEAPREEIHQGEDDAQMRFPTLEEPSWLEDDSDEEMEEPPDSPFRGMWIGIAAAAVTFVLVFAIPQWLGWYDIGPPPQAKRDVSPESLISTVTAKPSGTAVVETGPPAAPAVAAPPATAPPANPPKATAAPTVAKDTKPTPPAAAAAAKETKPAPPAVTPPPSPSRRTYSVQIAAFKNAKQAGQLAERVKRDGYDADVRRIESSAVPYAVRVGTYASREQAESARDALARKGFKGFIL